MIGIDLNCLLQASKKNMSDLESGMVTIIKVFHKYSGHKCNLKKAELKELINNEMSHFIMVSYGSKQFTDNGLLTSMCYRDVYFECVTSTTCCCKSDMLTCSVI